MVDVSKVLSIRDLHVRFRMPDTLIHAVKGVSLDVAKGETVAVVGESGSGKSQMMMAAMGLLATNGLVEGSAHFHGVPLTGQSTAALNKVRGAKITMIFQEPMTSLDPLYTIGDQMAAPIRHHQGLDAKAARVRSIELLRLVQIPEPERRLAAYPHELSGGQRQRVMIAMALANNPDLLIADEPTTALDVTVQAEILRLLKELKDRLGMAIIFITHDLGIVRRFADRVVVMRRGEIVETGPTASVFDAPRHDYTRMLLDAEPRGTKAPVPADARPILDAQDIRVAFPLPAPLFQKKREFVAVDGVSFRLKAGQTIGVVGESGSGKSTLGRAVLKLLPASGQITYEDRNLAPLDRAGMRPLRKSMQLVFQDPFGSLSPRMTVGQIVTEGLLVHDTTITARERDARAAKALEEVELDPAMRNRFPHEFSGGQRQRIAIARAMILKPKLVVLDEPTSALDRSVQKAIVDLLRRLQADHGLAYLFISHDLAVVRALADHIIVMKDGRVVEQGQTSDIFAKASQPYTQRLIEAAFLTALRA